MAESGIGGSDASFVSFAFAVTSVILIVLYIPWIIDAVRRGLVYANASRKDRLTMDNPLQSAWESVTYIPRVLRTLLAEPRVLRTGARVCLREKRFFFTIVLPRFLKFLARPRILVLWLWFFLLSSAMYSSLTFDPYAVLGIAASASTADIKKAYRTLSKRYHPDQNATAEAREVYIQVRRAYKALVNREAYEEEMRGAQDFAVGVALPQFLTSRNHDGLVLFGLLLLLFGGPLLIWYYFIRQESMRQVIDVIRTDKERTEHFLRHLGIPDDPRYTARRHSRLAILQMLVALKIVPPSMPEDGLQAFPPFADFVQRCIELEKNQAYLHNLGLNPAQMQRLNTYTTSMGVKLLDDFEAAERRYEEEEAQAAAKEAAEAETSKDEAGTSVRADRLTRHLLSPADYKAVRYLLEMHRGEVEAAIARLHRMLDTTLSNTRRLLNLHVETMEMLEQLYGKLDKPNKTLINRLIAVPQRTSEIVDAIEPEIQTLVRRAYRNMSARMAEARRTNNNGRRQ